ncbi:hypothetical protein QFZ60_003074 [Arthrobacter sp. B2I5]|nr:hypothetical protein [Arthrobacter sp. B2I5]MDQ0826901.1 hypothetical protein [Arthrobacter sp. B2I5]
MPSFPAQLVAIGLTNHKDTAVKVPVHSKGGGSRTSGEWLPFAGTN